MTGSRTDRTRAGAASSTAQSRYRPSRLQRREFAIAADFPRPAVGRHDLPQRPLPPFAAPKSDWEDADLPDLDDFTFADAAFLRVGGIEIAALQKYPRFRSFIQAGSAEIQFDPSPRSQWTNKSRTKPPISIIIQGSALEGVQDVTNAWFRD